MRYNVEKQDIQFKIEQLTQENKDFVVKNIFEEVELQNIDNFIEDKDCVGFFVYSDQDILGYIYGYILPRLHGRPMLYIHNVAVKKKYHHLGIGTLLMDTIKEFAKENKMLKIFLITNKSNKEAVGLFEKEKGKVPHKDDMLFIWQEEDM